MKRFILILAVLCLLASAALSVYAAVPFDNDTEKGLNVSLQANNRPIPGANVYIYKVADIKVNGGAIGYIPISPYDESGVDYSFMDDNEWSAFINGMIKYIDSNAIPADYVKASGSNGVASFSGIPSGLYIVRVSRASVGSVIYSFIPAAVIVPWPTGDDLSTNSWEYNVTIYPKPGEMIPYITTAPIIPPPPPPFPPETETTAATEATTAAITTPETTPEVPSETTAEPVDEPIPLVFPPEDNPPETVIEEPIPVTPTIPKSGLLWWPVPVLGAAGLGLLVCGAVIRKDDKDDKKDD